eukprot:TRINITY_DN78273_c0_g1_i1.p1 TRINITY_DN78273_c0_g1~~TRINITY_DN78273_c0_g1_i1.p1  ORF type:complete len:458 (+),score=58.23 TRINITY_DN78273_c0_g1_i1:1908-3281(+)
MKYYGSIPRDVHQSRDVKSALLFHFIRRVPIIAIISSLLGCVVFFVSDGWSAFNSTYSTAPARTLPASHLTVLDEDSQAGGTLSSDSSPRSWLLKAVKDWMSELSDSISIAAVSIPGTHDTGALFGGPACETQSWTIADQLKAGIRFFDIRCRRARDVFAIHHGLCFQHIFFDDVAKDMRDFLAAHPTEFILMRVQEEHYPIEGSLSFTSIWSRYMKRFGTIFVDKRSTLPTVGELRGKILTLRPSSLRLGKGIVWGGALTDIQDMYKVYFLPFDNPFGSDTVSLPQKEELVESYIDKAATSSDLVINFLSGANGMIPKDVAKATNSHAYYHIGPYKGAKRVGVIVMDFPGERLVYRVIKSNFNSKNYCGKATFRGQSDMTWVEFRMPRALVGTVVIIEGGAYGKFVFPKCHRVTWTDLRLECLSDKRWVVKHGSWDADGLCHSRNTNQKYVAVGDR